MIGKRPREAPAGGRETAEPASESAWLAAASGPAAAWTLASRLTGFLRLATIAAVLGPTYFGNLFQTVSIVPNILHDLLSGALISALLVPPLAQRMARGPGADAAALANGFLGVLVLIFALVAALGMLAAPWLLEALTAGVPDPVVRAQQIALGTPLLMVLLPQLCLYGIAATGAAVQHAHGRFALAAAAPVVENLGIVAVLLGAALLFPTGIDVGAVGLAEVLFLGLGSTAAAALHAAMQWWGAHRCGVTLVPRAGWRDPEVRRILRLAVPSSGNALLDSAAYVALLVVAGRIPGGVVAFQIGFGFMMMPVALWARPLATAQLARLAHGAAGTVPAALAETYGRSLALASFGAVPACLLFLTVPDVIATATAMGEMATEPGRALLAAAIGGLGLGVLGLSALHVTTAAAYAHRDALQPLRAMLVRTVAIGLGVAAATVLLEPGPGLLWALGGAFSLGTLIGAVHLHRVQTRRLPAGGAIPFRPAGDLAAGIAAALSALAVATQLGLPAATPPGRIGEALVVLAAGGIAYLLLQHLRRSPELASLLLLLRPAAAGRRPIAEPASRLSVETRP